MIVDGNHIAQGIFSGLKAEIAKLPRAPHLTVLTCMPNFETRRFLNIKMKRAREIGVEINVIELPDDATTNDGMATIAKAAEHTDGIVVQLPFPAQVDTDMLVSAIPHTHDVDAFLLTDPEILPPVVGAMKEILEVHKVAIEGKRVVVVGGGRLVGRPAAAWFTAAGAEVQIVTEADSEINKTTQNADVLVLGVGKAGLLTPLMVREGVVILDAGTSEAAGELRGDADPECAKKASLFTPVPGGIGPITVAVLLRNLVLLHARYA